MPHYDPSAGNLATAAGYAAHEAKDMIRALEARVARLERIVEELLPKEPVIEDPERNYIKDGEWKGDFLNE